MTTRRKIQLVLDESAQSTLEKLQKVTNASCMTDVIRDALGVYSSLYELLSSNESVQLAIVDKRAGEFQELTIPSFTRQSIVQGSVAKIKPA